jgi:MFS family permease
MTASTAIVQLTAAPSMRGRILALQSMVLLGSTPIGGPIVGLISQHFGARYSIALGGVATVAAGVFGVVKVRNRARTVELTPDAQRDTDLSSVSRAADRYVPLLRPGS